MPIIQGTLITTRSAHTKRASECEVFAELEILFLNIMTQSQKVNV